MLRTDRRGEVKATTSTLDFLRHFWSRDLVQKLDSRDQACAGSRPLSDWVGLGQALKDFLASHGYIHNTRCDEEVRGQELHFLGFAMPVVLVMLGIFSSEVGAEWFTTLGSLPR